MTTRLGVAEAARALGSSRSAIRKAIVRGTLAATQEEYVEKGETRFRYVVEVDEIERYRAAHRRPRKATA